MNEQGGGRCRWCRAPIKWCRTEKGRRMPLDVDPRPDGNVELVNGIGYVKGQSDDPADIRHMPHFATCPNRRKR